MKATTRELAVGADAKHASRCSRESCVNRLSLRLVLRSGRPGNASLSGWPHLGSAPVHVASRYPHAIRVSCAASRLGACSHRGLIASLCGLEILRGLPTNMRTRAKDRGHRWKRLYELTMSKLLPRTMPAAAGATQARAGYRRLCA